MAAIGTPKLDPDFRARDFFLKSVDGNYYGLDCLRGGAAMLVMFICNHCPYVKAIIGRLVTQCADLMEMYGVRVVAIMPNDTEAYPDDAYDKMVLFAQEHRFPFQYLIDESQDVARSYGAVCTPDFFCFNRDLALRYRGRFDDPKRAGETARSSELFEAVKHIVASGEAPVSQVPSIGCSIKWRCLDDVTN